MDLSLWSQSWRKKEGWRTARLAPQESRREADYGVFALAGESPASATRRALGSRPRVALSSRRSENILAGEKQKASVSMGSKILGWTAFIGGHGEPQPQTKKKEVVVAVPKIKVVLCGPLRLCGLCVRRRGCGSWRPWRAWREIAVRGFNRTPSSLQAR